MYYLNKISRIVDAINDKLMKLYQVYVNIDNDYVENVAKDMLKDDFVKYIEKNVNTKTEQTISETSTGDNGTLNIQQVKQIVQAVIYCVVNSEKFATYILYALGYLTFIAEPPPKVYRYR